MPKHLPGPKRKKITYLPKANIKHLEKRMSVSQALEPEVIRTEDIKRKAIKLHIRGKDHDYIAHKLKITTQEAHEYIREKIKQYVSSESFDPAEIKEVIARRYDSALSLAMYEAFPHPMTDEFGRPVMGNTCKCELAVGQLCSEEGHIAQRMTHADLGWLKAYLEVLGEQKKMYGIDAADKMKQKTVDILERTYRGVDPKVIENL